MDQFSNLLFLEDRYAWRTWLADNFGDAKEAWLVYPKAHTGKPRIAYHEAVEEALCFGWIDSTYKTVDRDHVAQRFTPRKPKSTFSQTNIERIRRLLAQGKVIPKLVPAAEQVAAQEFVFPQDLIAVLRANPIAWKNFQRYSPAYQRIRIAYIEHARKRPEEFKKRLKHFLFMTERDKQFGFGIKDFYSSPQ